MQSSFRRLLHGRRTGNGYSQVMRRPHHTRCGAADGIWLDATTPPGDPTVAQSGDIIKLDLGTQVDGYVTDNAVTVDLQNGPDSAMVAASRMAPRQTNAPTRLTRKRPRSQAPV